MAPGHGACGWPGARVRGCGRPGGRRGGAADSEHGIRSRRGARQHGPGRGDRTRAAPFAAEPGAGARAGRESFQRRDQPGALQDRGLGRRGRDRRGGIGESAMAARHRPVHCPRGWWRACGRRDRRRSHDRPQADQRPRARDRRRARHPVRRLRARRDAPGLRRDRRHRGGPDPRHAAAAGDERADEAAAALGLPDGHLPAGKRGVQSHRPRVAHAYPYPFPYRAAVAAGSACDHGDADRDPGPLGLPVSAIVAWRRGARRPSWQVPAVVSWAGTRGVVPLAAALSIPLTTATGSALPERDLVLVLATAVIAISLIVQGLTLEPLVRFAGISLAAPTPATRRPSHGSAWPRQGSPAWTNSPASRQRRMW